MSQHDMDVANGPGLTVRTDINAAIQALASNSVGPVSPATTFACQWWGDTTAGRLKRRNSANTAWIDMGALDALSYLLASGGKLTGPIDDATPQTIASLTTTDIGVATSNVVYISGTTTITGLGTIAAGARRTVRFLASLTLTHNVTSLILPTAANITTAANDTAEFVSLGSGNWLCLRYSPASGRAAANPVGTVSQSGGIPTGAIIETGSNANGFYTKWADGTMVAWGQYPGNGLTWTAGTGVRYAQFSGFPLPVNFVGAVRSATTAVNTDISTLSSYIANFAASGSTYSGYLAAPSGTTGTGTHTFNWICFGRWY
ncbi:hypothetical protein [Pseudomonas sp.]|uniref:hypothetical protein n=1 Tax=Pseudomonas sp. TaxID=306 RepID=UPI003264D121